MMRHHVDPDHDNDSTARSRTRFVFWLNSTPVYLHSKKQGSCEASSFSSEFIVMACCCENLRDLRQKLRTMDILVDFPVRVFADGQYFLTNSIFLHSKLKKKSLVLPSIL